MWKKRIKKIFKVFFITVGIILLILMILPYFFSIEHRKLDAKTKPFPNSYFFTSNHTRLHFRLWEPHSDTIKHYVLFVHGFSGSTFSFRNNIEPLVKNNCVVVAIDLPAFGYSDKSDSANYNDSARVDMICSLIRKINPMAKWTLIGHSMGASVIGNFATEYPDYTEGLVFIDGPSFESKGEGAGWSSSLAKFPPVCRWAEVLAKHKFVNYNSFKDLLSSAYSKPADSVAITGYMKPFEYERSATAIFDMAANGGYAKTDKAVLSKIPMLLLWGDKDEWLPIKLATDFKKQNPEIDYRIIKGAGHCSMETHANEVNQLIEEFLEKK